MHLLLYLIKSWLVNGKLKKTPTERCNISDINAIQVIFICSFILPSWWICSMLDHDTQWEQHPWRGGHQTLHRLHPTRIELKMIKAEVNITVNFNSSFNLCATHMLSSTFKWGDCVLPDSVVPVKQKLKKPCWPGYADVFNHIHT